MSPSRPISGAADALRRYAVNNQLTEFSVVCSACRMSGRAGATSDCSSEAEQGRRQTPTLLPLTLPQETYFTRVSILNIGMYIEMMMTPTMRPTPIIMIGSTIEVSDCTDASTSSS